jgi:hypothetical protein
VAGAMHGCGSTAVSVGPAVSGDFSTFTIWNIPMAFLVASLTNASRLSAMGKRCHFTAHRYFESGAYESMRDATAAFIADSRDHRRKVRARRRWLRRQVVRVLRR